MSLQPPSPPRSPWQLLYGAGHRLRRAWHGRRAARLPRPVVSVGNLHWGGGGKTPLTAALAARLRDRGLRVAILSRGYRSRGRGVRLVSDGRGPMLGPLLAGDEPVLLAGRLPGVAVLVGADRYEAGRHALERLSPPPDLFLLDDGFSHLRLARDVELLVFPADDPFAGGRLAPAGRLREPLAASAHADAVLLTAGEPGEALELERALRPFGFEGPAFASATEVGPAVTERGESLPPGSRLLLVAGIARPERLQAAAERLGLTVVGTVLFRDHHAYPERSLRRIARQFAAVGADRVLTTEKDQVKLLGRLELPLASLPIAARPQPEFWEWLERRLAPEA
ncbi:MAG: tetraacyldisaccharide 4'-kinase [Thermoanaerobaculia bacterium]|nr:tetraacyldisaccharide 4'-kinase [Thermoanaerobaculia bacterium]